MAATALTVVTSALPGTAFAAVWTDRSDYLPGERVTICGDNGNGAGYFHGETVEVRVYGPNGYFAECLGPDPAEPEGLPILVDENGTWWCRVTLCDSRFAAGDCSYTEHDSGDEVFALDSESCGTGGTLSNLSFDSSTSAGSYHFILWATDGSPDTVRNKTWEGEDTVI